MVDVRIFYLPVIYFWDWTKTQMRNNSLPFLYYYPLPGFLVISSIDLINYSPGISCCPWVIMKYTPTPDFHLPRKIERLQIIVYYNYTKEKETGCNLEIKYSNFPSDQKDKAVLWVKRMEACCLAIFVWFIQKNSMQKYWKEKVVLWFLLLMTRW